MSLRNFSALLISLVLGGLAAASNCAPALAQTRVQPRLTSSINESVRVTLKGNVPPLARPEYDHGAPPLSMPYTHMFLVLKRSAEQEAALQAYLQSVQDANSPNYHKWLTPEQFGRLYGPADADIQTLKIWLVRQGFTVDAVPPGRMAIEFSGTVAQVQNAFDVAIHSFVVKGKQFYSNTTDPQIPAALAPVVSGIANLNTIKPGPLYHRGPAGHFDPRSHKIVLTSEVNVPPEFTMFGGSGEPYLFIGPSDAAVIYDSPNKALNPSYSSGNSYDGTGVTIGIAGQSNIDLSAVSSYRTFFGLPATTPTVTVVGSDPGTVVPSEEEAILDLEIAGGLAPGASLHFYTSISAVDAANQAIQDNQVDILNVSFGNCEAAFGASGNQFIQNMWEQAAAQGIAITVASGDMGGAGCDAKDTVSAGAGMAVNGLASTAYDIAVGGTDFDVLMSSFNTYVDSSTSGSGPYYRTALGYIPEEPWNDSAVSSASGLPPTTLSANIPVLDTNNNTNVVAAGGGASSCIDGSLSTAGLQTGCTQGYEKPSWQRGTGVPSDGVRDLPDVSLFAGNGPYSAIWTVCLDAATSASGQTDCQLTGGVPTSSTTFDGFGGTSPASAAFAGILALVEQKTGSRLGQAAQGLYDLFNEAGSSSIFHDVTTGNISVPCASGAANCSTDAAGYDFLTGYDASTGYDLATGLGSVDVANLVRSWGTTGGLAVPTVTVTPSVSSIDYNQTLNVTVTVIGTSVNPTPTGTVTISSGIYTSLPSALTNGSTTIAVATNNLATGQNTLTATYAPDSTSSSIYLGAYNSTVITVNGPALSVSPASLTFNATFNQADVPAQAISISNTATGTLEWTAAASASWIALGAQSGTTPSTLNISVDVAGLAAGTYQGAVTVTDVYSGDSASPVTIPVMLTVTSGGGGGTGPLAYVTNYGSNNVSLIDGSKSSVVASITVGANPIDIAITPDGAFAYVLNAGSQDVSAIATATNTVVATVPVGAQSSGINYGSSPAITPDGSHVYVTNNGANSVSVISTATNSVVATIPVGQSPVGVAITPDGSFAYVTNEGSSSVSVIATATNTVTATIPVGGQPAYLAIAGTGSFVYVPNESSNTVSVISTATNTVVATVAVGAWPTAVAITPNGSYAYVTNLNSNSVSVISTASHTVVATVPVGSGPTGVAITPDGAYAYVVNQWSTDLSVIATTNNTVEKTIPVTDGNRPTFVAFIPAQSAVPVLSVSPQALTFDATDGGANPSSQAINITNTGSGALTWTAFKTQPWLSLDTSSGGTPSTINTSVDISGLAPGTYHDTISVTASGAIGSPASIPVTLTVTGGGGVSGAGPFAYVTDLANNTVSVIDGSTNDVVAVIPVGDDPLGIAITPDGAFAYVANMHGNSVSVIATATSAVIATIPVSGGPWGVAITPDGAFAYVTNFGSNSVSVIATSSNSVVTTIPVGIGPVGVAITPDQAFAYVTNAIDGTVSVITTASNTVVATVPVGENDQWVAITPDGALAYVANFGSSSISVIARATNTVVATIPVGDEPYGVAITPNGALAYVASFDSVSVVDTASNSVTATVPVGRNLRRIAITPDGAFAYVVGPDSNVSVIATATNAVATTIPVGSVPESIAFIPVKSSTPVLSTSNPSLTFSAIAGGSNPASQAINVTNSGSGTMDWTATKTQAWLSLDASSGAAPSTINVSVNISGLAPDTYHDTITITANGASNSPATIPITLTVTAAPVLAVVPTSLTFSATSSGANPASQALAVTNTGGGTLTWTASKTQSWLSLDTSSGTAPSTINASVDPSGLAPGTYQDTITITSAGASGSPQSVDVTLTVAATPDFTIDTPSGGNTSATVTAGSSVSYGLEATPLNGFTGKISFTCSGLPSKSTCSVNPTAADVTGADPAPFTLTIATTAPTTSGAGMLPGLGGSPWEIPAGAIFLFTTFSLLAGRRRLWRRLLMLAVITCAFGVTSCGGGSSSSNPNPIPGTPAGTYTVVLNSTSGNITHTTNLTLTVQ